MDIGMPYESKSVLYGQSSLPLLWSRKRGYSEGRGGSCEGSGRKRGEGSSLAEMCLNLCLHPLEHMHVKQIRLYFPSQILVFWDFQAACRAADKQELWAILTARALCRFISVWRYICALVKQREYIQCST